MLIANKHKQTIRCSNYFFIKSIFISRKLDLLQIVYQNINGKNTIIYCRLETMLNVKKHRLSALEITS